jgi:hypothetical protein
MDGSQWTQGSTVDTGSHTRGFELSVLAAQGCNPHSVEQHMPQRAFFQSNIYSHPGISYSVQPSWDTHMIPPPALSVRQEGQEGCLAYYRQAAIVFFYI